MAYVNDPTQGQPQAPPAGGQAPTPTGPATTPSPNAPAPGNPTAPGVTPGAPVHSGGAAPGVQTAAAPIGTPGTAASQPMKDSPWAYEKMWGALGSLGDPELDAATKSGMLRMMRNNPFGADQAAEARRGIFEQGMAQARGGQQELAADLARRGITGPAAAAIMAEQEAAARGGIAAGQRESDLAMKEKGAQHQLQVQQTAQALTSDLAKRGVDIENLRMNREQLARQIQQARAAGAGGSDMIELMNPDGTTSQVPLDILGLVLDMEEGGLY